MENTTSRDTSGFIKEVLSIIIVALVLAMLIRFFVVEARWIPSGSMKPTIQENDRVLVNRFIYRFQDPERLDVIVFEPPLETGYKDDFIKRVIGLPGDRVEVAKGQVFINGQPLKEDYINEKPNYSFGPVTVPPGSYFVMGDNRNHSFDSHQWNSWLTKEHIKGKAFLTYWPLGRWGSMK
ncbi:MAG: signal peptidase I [Firmicutes bacterium]|nr:signal peptidase I [Bacillota bacterium]